MRRELVARCQGLERLVRQRQRVLLQHRRLVLVHPQDEVAVANRLELVERVQQAEHVERGDVVRIGLEGSLERDPRTGLISGPQQMRSQIREGVRVPRIEHEPPARERNRLVEAIVVPGQLAGGAIDFSVVGGDGERPGDFGFEVRLLVFDVGERGEERVRVEARRIDEQRLVQPRPRLVMVIGVGGFARQKHLCFDRERIDLERFLRDRGGLRRIVFFKRASRADDGRRIPRVRFQRDLERLDRLALVVRLEEQLAPLGVDLRILGRGRRGVAKRRVRRLDVPERAQRPPRTRQLRRILAAPRKRGDPAEDPRGIRSAQHVLEQTELEGGFARWRAIGDRAKDDFGVRVAATSDRRATWGR